MNTEDEQLTTEELAFAKKVYVSLSKKVNDREWLKKFAPEIYNDYTEQDWVERAFYWNLSNTQDNYVVNWLDSWLKERTAEEVMKHTAQEIVDKAWKNWLCVERGLLEGKPTGERQKEHYERCSNHQKEFMIDQVFKFVNLFKSDKN